MNLRLRIFIAIVVSLSHITEGHAQVKQKHAAKTVVSDTADDTEDEKTNVELQSLVDAQYKNSGSGKRFAEGVFKSTRIINGQSIENVPGGVLEFRISHRFGELQQGAKTSFGFDNATTRLGLNYGLTNWLMIGAGRSTYQKEYDGFVKIKLLRQTWNDGMPISVSFVSAPSIQALPSELLAPKGTTYNSRDRLYFTNQLLLARKFSPRLSLQLMPTYIHYNIVATSSEPNNEIAMGAGGRFKLSKRIALTAEYYYRLPSYSLNGYSNSLSVGIDIETGGHVFQLFLTNSADISERTFIEETTGNWAKGGIHFGFNLSRVFYVVKHR